MFAFMRGALFALKNKSLLFKLASGLIILLLLWYMFIIVVAVGGYYAIKDRSGSKGEKIAVEESSGSSNDSRSDRSQFNNTGFISPFKNRIQGHVQARGYCGPKLADKQNCETSKMGFTSGDLAKGGHSGVDWNTPPGDQNLETVVAVGDGVAFEAPTDGWGHAVLLLIPDKNYLFLYAHLSKVNDEFKGQKGVKVKKGTPLGITGGTGRGFTKQFPAHLHLEAYKLTNKEAGSPQSAMTVLAQWSKTLDPADVLGCDGSKNYSGERLEKLCPKME
ncbi:MULTISPECIES: M23 family metallopeptidase [Bacillus]|uniref:M23 family metallopeptidase n=1 Tax=Bacillus glycinifermentans TaxID=1664069 RepID=A0A0T6BNB4_9BACI|nr:MULTISPECIES: M23 family metallopeptidase [Bacillus]KRT93085.1 hypothetical protein AB447_203895 [Bacillus glycinifermentans]MEC0341934.1 M23 family metallopeptidase [Bacillus sonorensis]MEC0457380.1 M23 family metallopeptidase [Bacillus sonorensis]MEC0487896.1 M23 family metallopeptidase [Bacillus glycinifermentans]MEC0530653.1 M23 family metallopeptidase [Bacillus sonorensis]